MSEDETFTQNLIQKPELSLLVSLVKEFYLGGSLSKTNDYYEELGALSWICMVYRDKNGLTSVFELFPLVEYRSMFCVWLQRLAMG